MPVPPTGAEPMEDIIERTLRERRPLQQALADLLAKCSGIPPGNDRNALERMIEGLQEEIELRRRAPH